MTESQLRHSSKFSNLRRLPPLELSALTRDFKAREALEKVNLAELSYRTEAGLPWVMPCVRKAMSCISEDPLLNHGYLHILGLASFCRLATGLLLGEANTAVSEGRAFGVQTLSGSGALRVAAELLATELGFSVFYYPDAVWENHVLTFKKAGFNTERKYRYWDADRRTVDAEGLLADLAAAPPSSVVVLLVAGPTGRDPSDELWERIAAVMRERDLFPVFHVPHQGLVSGDPGVDARPVRRFVQLGFETLVAQSFAANFGLSGERVGCLTVVVSEPGVVRAVKSQLVFVVRGLYSTPPAYGARVVSMILGNRTLCAEWRECLRTMTGRLRRLREEFRAKLEALGTPMPLEHLTQQAGMFSYTGLGTAQVRALKHNHHVFLPRSGRINVSYLNHNNIDYVANAFYEVVLREPNESKLY